MLRPLNLAPYAERICLAIDKEHRVLTARSAHGFSFGFLQPDLQFLLRDQALLTFILLRSGTFAPIVKLLVGDPSGLDPRKAPLILFAVCLEDWVIRLFRCPLLESPDLPTDLLSSWNRTLTILRADPSGLRKPSSAVLAAPHGDVPLHATPQRVVDHVPDAGGIQHRRTPPRLHRLKAERDGAETKQAGIFRHIVGLIFCRLCLRFPACAVYIQHQLKKALDLLLIPRKLFRELAQFVQYLRILRTASVILNVHR